MATKIFWNKAELAAVRERLEHELVANPLLRSEEALRRAQSVLPEPRRRKVSGGAIYRYKELIDGARSTAATRRKIEQQRVAAPIPQPAPPAPAPVAQPDLLRAMLEPLLDALVDKLVKRLVVQVANSAREPELRVKHNPEPPSSERAPRTGVLVIGLLPSQAAAVVGCFPNLEVTCLTSEEALKRDPLRRAYTVLMTKFISHSVQDRYRKAPNLQLCNGGVSELTEILARIA